jgi:DNA-binding GntR family transcriptional regulator
MRRKEKTMEEFKPQYSVLLVEQIVEYLTGAIIEGHLKMGERLVESDLQRKLGVSRTPIREAFRVLEESGLVVKKQRSGTYVCKISEKDIRENFPIRAWMEGLCARFAVPNMNEEEIDALKFNFAQMEGAVEENDFSLYFKRHNDFHNVFIGACKNERLIKLVTTIRQDVLWSRFTYLWHQENYKQSLPVHKKILGLFAENDEEAIELLVRNHILANTERYVEYLSTDKEKSGAGKSIEKRRRTLSAG